MSRGSTKASDAHATVPAEPQVLLTVLRTRLPNSPRGYVTGKTAMRDVVVDVYHVSMVVAEAAIDQLEAGGFIRYPGETELGPDERQPWLLDGRKA